MRAVHAKLRMARAGRGPEFIGPPRNLRLRYNIAPTTTVDVVRSGEGGNEIGSMLWGLVPAWWKKPLKDVPATFNARAETVAEKTDVPLRLRGAAA